MRLKTQREKIENRILARIRLLSMPNVPGVDGCGIIRDWLLE